MNLFFSVTISHKFCNDLQRQDTSQSFWCACHCNKIWTTKRDPKCSLETDLSHKQKKLLYMIHCVELWGSQRWAVIWNNQFIHKIALNLKFNNFVISSKINFSQIIYYITILSSISLQLFFFPFIKIKYKKHGINFLMLTSFVTNNKAFFYRPSEKTYNVSSNIIFKWNKAELKVSRSYARHSGDWSGSRALGEAEKTPVATYLGMSQKSSFSRMQKQKLICKQLHRGTLLAILPWTHLVLYEAEKLGVNMKSHRKYIFTGSKLSLWQQDQRAGEMRNSVLLWLSVSKFNFSESRHKIPLAQNMSLASLLQWAHQIKE